MPGESYIQLPPNSTGLKAHTNQRTIGANNVEDEVVVIGEQYLPSYITSGGLLTPSVATANTFAVLHAGASLKVRIRRIRVWAADKAATADSTSIALYRVTTAPTGGTSVVPEPLEPADVAGARIHMSPTGGATLGQPMALAILPFYLNEPISSIPLEWNFDLMGTKALVIAAGTANGIGITTPQL